MGKKPYLQGFSPFSLKIKNSGHDPREFSFAEKNKGVMRVRVAAGFEHPCRGFKGFFVTSLINVIIVWGTTPTLYTYMYMYLVYARMSVFSDS